MPAKHRCSCFSEEASSFLYGLRREAPSTERVLLERLLNILSRAAANKNNNPQRLWAESERPKWWTEVTKLAWKNPREHPKDNKKVLKEKIEILEKQLKQRGLMRKELEEELEVQKNGKKTDLELKSDFEAVIAKASGLHFMLNKVKDKMGDKKPISERISKYVKETKACMEKCLAIIQEFYGKVEKREQHTLELWDKFGVSKEESGPTAPKRPHSEASDDLETDSLTIDLDEASPEDMEAINQVLSSPSPFSPSPYSPASAFSLSPRDISDTTVADMVMGAASPAFIPQSQYVHAQSTAVSSYHRSVSQHSPVQDLPETLARMERVQLRSLSPLPESGSKPSAKKSRRRSDGAETASYRLMPRGDSFQPRTPVDTLIEALSTEEVEIVEHSQATLPPVPRGGDSKRVSESDVLRRRDRRQRQSPHDRPKSSGIREKLATPPRVEAKEKRKSASLPLTVRYSGGQTLQVAGQPKPEPGWQELHTIPVSEPSWQKLHTIPVSEPGWQKLHTIPVSEQGWQTHAKSDVFQTSPLPVDDLVEDGDGSGGVRMEEGRAARGEDLEDVTEVLEESVSMPTANMYAETDMISEMDHLAQMTTTLSCEDLQASVTVPVMDSTPTAARLVSAPPVVFPGHHVVHCDPLTSSAAAATATSGAETKSLSRAIGDLKDFFK